MRAGQPQRRAGHAKRWSQPCRRLSRCCVLRTLMGRESTAWHGQGELLTDREKLPKPAGAGKEQGSVALVLQALGPAMPLTCPDRVSALSDRRARSRQLHGVSVTLTSVCLSCSLMQGKLSQPSPLCMFSYITFNFKTVPKHMHR